ncbi:serpin H1-like [Uranotaenia lowii]|uniref:serpin H1-like n=1 Tax=Uranotaenia lowii TaxID=190385 RepID=UPI0024795353|nr:serpin H1-like [Uranotaenia lowii]
MLPWISSILWLLLVSQSFANLAPGEPEEEQIDINEKILNYTIRYYQKRYVDGQNMDTSPLLVLSTLMDLQNVSDASSLYDLHTLVDLAHNTTEAVFTEVGDLSRELMNKTDKVKASSRLFVDSSIQNINHRINQNLTVESVSFRDAADSLKTINKWAGLSGGTDEVAKIYQIKADSKALLIATSTSKWALGLSQTSKKFQDKETTFLEGTVQGRYKSWDQLQAEIVELRSTTSKLWLILPKEGSSIARFSESLTDENFKQIVTELEGSSDSLIPLSVPKVTIEYNSQEDAFLKDEMRVFTTMSYYLQNNSDTVYSFQNFLVKCIVELTDGGAPASGGTPSKAVEFTRPFVIVILSNEGNIPLVMANYFSPVDKIHELEDLLAQLEAEEGNGNQEL